jgi:hypothetical protein
MNAQSLKPLSPASLPQLSFTKRFSRHQSCYNPRRAIYTFIRGCYRVKQSRRGLFRALFRALFRCRVP